jgi:hypothetical protein
METARCRGGRQAARGRVATRTYRARPFWQNPATFFEPGYLYNTELQPWLD